MGENSIKNDQAFDQVKYLEKLNSYHGLFYNVFQLGKPSFSTEIPTAAVGFNESTGKIEFLLNKKFFYKLGEQEQLFVISHEAMHVLFSHLDRTRKFKLNPELANIAQDIVINELLVSEFGFKKEELNFGFDLCFINTVFSPTIIEKEDIQPGKGFEYYYDLLVKYDKSLNKGATVMDQHSGEPLPGTSSGKDANKEPKGSNGAPLGEIPQEVAESIARNAMSNLSDDEQEKLLESLDEAIKEYNAKAGSENGGGLFGITLEEKQKNPWEKIIRNKVSSLLKKDNRELESFRQKPRRLTMLPDDMFLPEYLEEENNKNDKFNLFFFLDSSGSCIGYKNSFFNLARSIPEDKFNVTLFSFDTRVYKLDVKKPSVRGGGGTSFGPIERAIQNEISKGAKKQKYPDLVFILTDGEGTSVRPEKPENWYWLLTGNYTRYIPNDSQIVPLRKFKNKEVIVTKKKSMR